MTATPSGRAEALRRKAEEDLARRPASLQFNDPERQRLLHELQVHQIELQMQNDELREAGESMRKLSLAVEQTPLSIIITDLEGAIEYANDAYCASSGYALDDVLGRNPRFQQSGQTPQRTYDDLWQTLLKGEIWRGEFTNRRKNGEIYIEAEVIAPVRQADGRITHYLGIKEDVTERKRVEAELRHYREHLEELVADRTAELVIAKDAAEAANRAKSTFLANMSHELRTPMNGIMGMLELARRRMADPAGIDKLDKARDAANALLGILNDILDIAKIEAEHMVLEDAPLQIATIVAKLAGLAGDRAAAKGLVLDADIPDALARLPLQGDPLRLGQVLLNLVTNAIKFTEQGRITLSARQVDESPEAIRVRFEVTDTGIGIDAEPRTRLFTAFEQADNSTTRKYGGTGLGLAICKRLVQLMDGEIGVDSVPGAGSTFWFSIPLRRQSPDAVPPAPTVVAADANVQLRRKFHGARILLAEDEPVGAEIARHMLEEAGFIVDRAGDGAQALEFARRNPYALILMDMQMPVMNGVEATMAIRAESLNRETPILAMTANAYTQDRATCLAAGMNEHLAKPVMPDLLYNAMLTWLTRPRDRVPP